MGAFFTNVQVRSEDRVAVVAAIEQSLAAAGLRRAQAGEPVDRTVLVVTGAGWTSVYDQGTEDQDEDKLRGLLLALSHVGPAVSTLVHDSDVWMGEVATGGQVHDRFVSDPGYFGEKRAKRADRTEHPHRWARTLGVEPAQVKAAFVGSRLYAEEAVATLARGLGIDPMRLGTGFRYREAEAEPGEFLRFSWVVRPASEVRATGTPRLESEWTSLGVEEPQVQATEVAVGAAVVVHVTTLSTGGPGTGVVVTVSSADGESPVVWEHVDLAVGDPSRREGWRRGGLDRGTATIEVEVPAGPGERSVLTTLEGRIAVQVHANVHGRAVYAGTGQWEVTVAPVGGAGSTVPRAVRVMTTEDRPLRAPATVAPAALARLRDRRFLVGLVVLEPEQVGLAFGTVLPLIPWFPTEGKVSVATFYRAAGAPPKRPKTARAAAAGFFSGKAWSKLAWGPEIAQLDVSWDRTDREPEGPARFSVGCGILGLPGSVPALTVVLPAHPEAEIALVAGVDRLAASGAVIQALVTRWGSHPSVEMTPYEMATGIMGQCTLQKPWVERWLRGIGPGTLWLGPALSARVGPVGEPVGPTRRLRVDEVAETERLLASLLPASADWMDGIRAMMTARG